MLPKPSRMWPRWWWLVVAMAVVSLAVVADPLAGSAHAAAPAPHNIYEAETMAIVGDVGRMSDDATASGRPALVSDRTGAASGHVPVRAEQKIAFTARPVSAATTTTAGATALSPTAIALTWTPPPVAVDRWIITMSTVADKTLMGRQTVCGTCFSTRFDYLSPATGYGFLFVGVGGDAGDGVWAWAGATTPRDPLCPAPATCLVADSSTSLGPVTQVGLGLNQGITARTDATKLTPLSLNYHRIAAWDERSFKTARATGGQISVIVSSAWKNWTTVTYGVAMDPWDDWAAYYWFVAYLVGWHQQNNLLPDYWEIQNEPDQAPWYFGTTTPPAIDLVLKQFQTAHDAIRAVLPEAKITGPSIGAFDEAAQSIIDIRTFLQYAAEHGLRIDVISWHELGGDCWGACDAGPRGIAQHVASVQNLLAQYPSIGQPEIHIDEYGDPAIYATPGATVGYFAAMAANGVRRAASACWPAIYEAVTHEPCFANPGMADGLLKPDGTTPTARWFVWRTYAGMTGNFVRSNVARPDMSVVATQTTTGAIEVLVGRQASTSGAADSSVQVRVKVPTACQSYRVTARSQAPDAGTEQVSDRGTVAASNGVLDLGAFTVANGSSLSFSLRPALWRCSVRIVDRQLRTQPVIPHRPLTSLVHYWVW